MIYILIKKSVNLSGTINMVLTLNKLKGRADYIVSWMVDNREMQGKTYHGKKNALKVFNTIHANYEKVRWYDEIK